MKVHYFNFEICEIKDVRMIKKFQNGPLY